MENKTKEVEILDIEEISDDDFYELRQEFIANNSIYSNMDLQFNQLMLK